jgi:hypothetical protein
MSSQRIVPVEGQWERNKPEDALTSLQWATLIIGVVAVVIGVIGKIWWLATVGGSVIGFGVQVWVLLTFFRAWQHESRHQNAAIVEPHQPPVAPPTHGGTSSTRPPSTPLSPSPSAW